MGATPKMDKRLVFLRQQQASYHDNHQREDADDAVSTSTNESNDRRENHRGQESSCHDEEEEESMFDLIVGRDLDDWDAVQECGGDVDFLLEQQRDHCDGNDDGPRRRSE